MFQSAFYKSQKRIRLPPANGTARSVWEKPRTNRRENGHDDDKNLHLTVPKAFWLTTDSTGTWRLVPFGIDPRIEGFSPKALKNPDRPAIFQSLGNRH